MTAAENVAGAYARISADQRPEVWISLRPAAQAHDEARVIDDRSEAGEELPLAGMTLAVKDDIDVAGMETTAGCPSFAYRADADAEAVARLRGGGGDRDRQDQHGSVRDRPRRHPESLWAVQDARRLEYVSGGSSSGSAVAVALSQVDVALATDTAGSSRVPAAYQGIFGIKPTRGLVPTLGMVPASPTLDCVSMFARTLELAQPATTVMWGAHADDPRTGALATRRSPRGPGGAADRSSEDQPARRPVTGASPQVRRRERAVAGGRSRGRRDRHNRRS